MLSIRPSMIRVAFDDRRMNLITHYPIIFIVLHLSSHRKFFPEDPIFLSLIRFGLVTIPNPSPIPIAALLASPVRIGYPLTFRIFLLIFVDAAKTSIKYLLVKARGGAVAGSDSAMKLFPMSSSSPKEAQSNGGRGGGGGCRAPLYLNIYDLTPVNNYLYWFGFGIFHSGIEVHGMEYGFGAHEYPTSGVFEVEPRSCPGFLFRKSILLGTTDMSRTEFRSFMESISSSYHGDTYHLIAKNCNHFTDDVSLRLTGKPIPGWVNRLARVGSFCNCLLPENIQVQAVRHLPDHPIYSDEDDDSDSASNASTDSHGEDPDHHLLTTPNSDIAYLKDKPVRLAKELM